ncbi:hypothetical protein [uncultured Herbaspirillum sp.]|uniref:hypothetical protein n=1 Tax=uncultured Herbaspirillum sp. TaxID=160236 RepID=UPI0025841B2B|nr:hypothetical protein [uncultured Herbaspirillum sp.]
MLGIKLKLYFCALMVLAVTGCSTTTPHPKEVAAITKVIVTRTKTPPLTLPTFMEGFLISFDKTQPSLLSGLLKPDEEKLLQLVPPTIPDFGRILAEDIYVNIPKAFKAWPPTEFPSEAASERVRSGDMATLEVSITKQQVSWVHGHLMTFVTITLYSAAGEVLMKENMHVNSLYVPGSKKIDEVAMKGDSIFLSEYGLASDEIVRKLTEKLILLGFR